MKEDRSKPQSLADTVFIAVGDDVEASKLIVFWALQNFHENSCFCIIHVLRPSKLSGLEEDEIGTTQEERNNMNSILNEYLSICHQAGVKAEILHIEVGNVGKGIVELIYRHTIKQLVMGAAADTHYSEYKTTGTTNLKSKKAIYVSQHMPHFCQTWFICKGRQICTWKGNSGGANAGSPSRMGSSYMDRGQLSPKASLGLDHSPLLFKMVRNSASVPLERTESSESELGFMISEEDLLQQARAYESLYNEELRHRQQIEEDLKKMKQLLDEARLNNPDRSLLETELLSALEMIDIHNNERDDLQRKLDNANKANEELLKKQREEASRTNAQHFFSKFSVSEINEATDSFHSSLKIAEGGYGNVYRGSLHHTPVAIKVLGDNSLQGPAEFQQEVAVLGKLRHPNVVTLIGACPENFALIYEYLPNGSLQDRLSCKDNTPPLSWQTRIRIAIEICSALIFLHSSKPQSIVHGDLKPDNILLDANFVSKLGDFGTSRALSRHQSSGNGTPFHRTDNLRGTWSYIDPHFARTGELSPESDVYSFGIILLQLLTGRSLRVVDDVQEALDRRNLGAILDSSAGEWPFVQAKQLARLALKCCAVDRRRRPDLDSEVWRALKPMRASCGSSSSIWSDSQEPPPYFICPIFQEVMEDPQVAADGYTYEAAAIRGWLENGRNSSPITNLPLAHNNLVPNHPLRSAIQEWQRRR